ncbi:hypothetical protein Ancab_032541 [Ancistrocladus abbreviatus]
MFELFVDSDEIHLYITESKTPSAVVNLASSSGNLFPSQPYNDYECGDSEIDNIICKTHGSSTITNYGNRPGGVLASNDNDVDVDVNAYVSGYITSDDEWLSNDEVRDATISYLFDSSLLGNGDESSDDIDFDDLKMIDKVGLMFCDKIHFIEALTDFAAINGFNMFRFKHPRSRFTAVCSNDEECPWRIHASLHPDDLKANPNMSITGMKKLVMERYVIEVPYMQLYRARLRAKEIINGSFSQSYSQLPMYVDMIMQSNLGSKAFIS